MSNTVELGSGGSELIITRRSDDGILTRMLGSREYLRYYRQKPRPAPTNGYAITAALASRLATFSRFSNPFLWLVVLLYNLLRRLTDNLSNNHVYIGRL